MSSIKNIVYYILDIKLNNFYLITVIHIIMLFYKLSTFRKCSFYDNIFVETVASIKHESVIRSLLEQDVSLLVEGP